MATNPQYGDRLEIRLVRVGANVLYTEPFTLQEGYSYKLENAMSAFKEGAEGAIADLERDIKTRSKFKDISSVDLVAEVQRRGYAVTKC